MITEEKENFIPGCIEEIKLVHEESVFYAIFKDVALIIILGFTAVNLATSKDMAVQIKALQAFFEIQTVDTRWVASPGNNRDEPFIFVKEESVAFNLNFPQSSFPYLKPDSKANPNQCKGNCHSSEIKPLHYSTKS